ncbi:MAG: hypothetical protein R3Y06_02330 [Faecalibacterium sp.]
MDYAWFNLSALIFGVAAWLLPFTAMAAQHKKKVARAAVLVQGGLACAVLSLLSVIVYQTYLVSIEDWSALMDTTNAVQFVSVVMALVAIALAVLAMGYGYYRAKQKQQ